VCTKIKYSIDPVPLIACTLTTDNLLTLANIITTSGIDRHCPPSLGVFTSVQVIMLYLQENLRQQTLAGIFGTSQPTISRAINNVLRYPCRSTPTTTQRPYAPTVIRTWWHARAMLVVEER